MSEYFKKIDTPVKAYIFGLLWADGCISQRRLAMSVKTDDIELLTLIQSELGGVLKSRERFDKRTEKIYKISDWYLYSQELINQIQNRGFRVYPKFAKKLLPWFVLGFFDGDGNIHLTKADRVQVSFAGPKNHNWGWFYKIIKTMGTFAFTEIHHTSKRGHSGSDVRIFGREALRLLDCIQIGNLGLSRKRALYLKAKDIYSHKRHSPVRRTNNRTVI